MRLVEQILMSAPFMPQEARFAQPAWGMGEGRCDRICQGIIKPIWQWAKQSRPEGIEFMLHNRCGLYYNAETGQAEYEFDAPLTAKEEGYDTLVDGYTEAIRQLQSDCPGIKLMDYRGWRMKEYTFKRAWDSISDEIDLGIDLAFDQSAGYLQDDVRYRVMRIAKKLGRVVYVEDWPQQSYMQDLGVIQQRNAWAGDFQNRIPVVKGPKIMLENNPAPGHSFDEEGWELDHLRSAVHQKSAQPITGVCSYFSRLLYTTNPKPLSAVLKALHA